MPVRPVRSSEEMCELMRSAPPPTADDVWVARDGRKLDTPEKVLAHIEQLNAEIAREDRERQDFNKLSGPGYLRPSIKWLSRHRCR